MWEKILVTILVILAVILYAFTVHLDRALDDPIIQDNIPGI
jgi:hypothetical protein